MNKESIIIILVLAALIIIGSIIAFDWPLFEINPDLSNSWDSILLKYTFIVVIAERSIAVYNSIVYEAEKSKLERRIKYYKKKLNIFSNLNDSNKGTFTDGDPEFQQLLTQRNDPKDVTYLNILEQLDRDLEKEKEKIRVFSLRALMFFGVIFAICGLSLMSDIIDVSRQWYNNASLVQQVGIRMIDIIITGALIGGGSKSFHAITSTTQSLLEKVQGN